MDLSTTFGLLVVIVAAVVGEDLTVSIRDDYESKVSVGDKVVLTCYLNEGLMVMLSHKFSWSHVSLADPDNEQETVLSNNNELTDAASPNDYTAEKAVNPDNSDEFTYVLTINKIQATNDGKYVCKAIPTSDDTLSTLSVEAELTVKRDVEQVALTFDREDPVTDESTVSVGIDEGEYSAHCTVTGFSGPQVHVHMLLDDTELSLDDGGATAELDKDASQTAGARVYMTKVSKAALDLNKDNKKLSCKAHAGFEGATEKMASFPLHVVQMKPNITCSKNNTAYVGDKYVKLTCLVDHKTVEVDRYEFVIEDTGERISINHKSENFNEIVEKPLSEEKDEVQLDLHTTKEWHFKTKYYLNVYLKDDPEPFKSQVNLIKLESTSGASMTSVSLGLVLGLSALLSTILSL